MNSEYFIHRTRKSLKVIKDKCELWKLIVWIEIYETSQKKIELQPDNKQIRTKIKKSLASSNCSDHDDAKAWISSSSCCSISRTHQVSKFKHCPGWYLMISQELSQLVQIQFKMIFYNTGWIKTFWRNFLFDVWVSDSLIFFGVFLKVIFNQNRRGITFSLFVVVIL